MNSFKQTSKKIVMPLERNPPFDTDRILRGEVLRPCLIVIAMLAIPAVLVPVMPFRTVALGLSLGMLAEMVAFTVKLHVAGNAFRAGPGTGRRSMLRYSFSKYLIYIAFLVPGFLLPEIFNRWAVMVGLFIPKVILVVTQVIRVRRGD